MYWKYFKYVVEHKKNVFIECWKEGLYLHALTHDLSKFHPKEFFAYARWFYGEFGTNIDTRCCSVLGLTLNEQYKEDFDKAWQHHKDYNKHHWNYWHEKNEPMPSKYIRQMVCDWRAMSRKFGGTAKEYYLKNCNEIKLNKCSRKYLEKILSGIVPVENKNVSHGGIKK